MLELSSASLALQIAVGVALLMLGRRLYWMFVAGIGFIVALHVAGEVLELEQEWVTLAVALLAGIIGALLAVFLQKLAVAVAGFLAVAYLVQMITTEMGFDGRAQTITVVVAGVIGAIVAGALFDWALILISSLTGAALLVESFDLPQQAGLVVMLVVAVAGISIQANMMHREGKSG